MGKMLIDQAVNQGDMNLIIKYGLLLAGLTLIALMFGVLSGRLAAVASTGFAKNLRSDMYKRIQKFSFANIDKYSTSSLVTRMTTDVHDVQFSYMMIIRTAIRAPLVLIFSTIMAFRVGGNLGLIFVLVVPMIGLGLFLIAKIAK